jgi:dipeptidyl aminopeptidase/acylaminoacyl peptidase
MYDPTEVKMKKGLFILFCLLLALAACTAQTVMEPEAAAPSQEESADTQPVGVDRDTDSTVTENETAAETQAETAAEPAVALSPLNGIPVVRFTGAKNELYLFDLATGEEMESFAPMNIGRNFNFLLAPDGQTLAVIAYSTDDFYNGKLHLIDLNTWQAVETDVHIPKFSSAMAFSPNGTRLVIAHQGRGVGYNGQPENYILTVVDVTTAAQAAIASEITVAFAPKLLSYTPDGASIIVYGGELAPQKTAEAQPAHAVLLNAADLSVAWEQLLPGVLDGDYFSEEVANGETAMIGYHPATVLSPDKMTLYIVHADEDKLTTVNFTDRHAETVEVRPPQTFFDRLMALTAGVAYAKYYDGTDKQAVLSPDGSRLYVVGWTADTTVTEEGEFIFDSYAHGLKVIDTSNGTEVASLEIDAAGIKMSADGTQLYIYGWNGESPYTDVYDAASLEKVTHLDNNLAFPGRGLDGRPLLLSNTYLFNNQSRLAILDPTTLEQVSVNVMGGYGQFLTDQRLVGYGGH